MRNKKGSSNKKRSIESARKADRRARQLAAQANGASIDLNDPRLTRQEVHLLRTIFGRVNGCSPGQGYTKRTAARALFRTDADLLDAPSMEPDSEGGRAMRHLR